MPGSGFWRILFWVGLFFLPSGATLAHDPRPVAVTITEELPEVFQASLRVPMTVDADNQPQLVWPDNCVPLSQGNRTSLEARNCPGGLQDQRLSLTYPLFNPSLATFYQVTDREGTSRSAMVPPTESHWVVPEQPGSGEVAGQYLLLGFEHILAGPDHLLFVLGLLVIAGTGKRILWTVTGFTLAHSITLSLSSLGMIHLPIVPVEAGIALSILFLAVEISGKRHDTLTYRYPLLVSLVFGLLHGLGFASALGEIGLVPGEVVLSLLFFNIGVELGQVVFILIVVVGATLLGRVLTTAGMNRGLLKQRADWFAMYLVGIPSAYWVVDRVSFLY